MIRDEILSRVRVDPVMFMLSASVRLAFGLYMDPVMLRSPVRLVLFSSETRPLPGLRTILPELAPPRVRVLAF